MSDNIGGKVDLLEIELVGYDNSVCDELRRKYINKFFDSGQFKNTTTVEYSPQTTTRNKRDYSYYNIYRSVMMDMIVDSKNYDISLMSPILSDTIKDFIYWYKNQLIEELRDKKINDLI